MPSGSPSSARPSRTQEPPILLTPKMQRPLTLPLPRGTNQQTFYEEVTAMKDVRPAPPRMTVLHNKVSSRFPCQFWGGTWGGSGLSQGHLAGAQRSGGQGMESRSGPAPSLDHSIVRSRLWQELWLNCLSPPASRRVVLRVPWAQAPPLLQGRWGGIQRWHTGSRAGWGGSGWPPAPGRGTGSPRPKDTRPLVLAGPPGFASTASFRGAAPAQRGHAQHRVSPCPSILETPGSGGGGGWPSAGSPEAASHPPSRAAASFLPAGAGEDPVR